MLLDILIPFLAVGLAELGDKTQLAVFCLAAKTKRYLQLFLGVMLAFLVADGLAILLGGFLTMHVPLEYVRIGSGIIFLLIGILILVNNRQDAPSCTLKTPFLSGFGLVLVSEMGDKTQIASALFATKYNAFLVLIGVMLALATLTLMAIYLGKYLLQKLNYRQVNMIAGVIFILLGVWSLVG